AAKSYKREQQLARATRSRSDLKRMLSGASFSPVNYAAFLTTVFGASFLLPTGCALAATARLRAQRFFRAAATIAALPAALNLRLRLIGCGVAGSDTLLAAAHLLRCASAMRLRASALIIRRVLSRWAGAAFGWAPLSM